MDPDKLEGYWLAITELEAQDLLLQLRVSQYPWLKKEDQVKTHRQFYKLAYPRTLDGTEEVLTTEQLAEKVRVALN